MTNSTKCRQCRGAGVLKGAHWLISTTDSDNKIALADHDEKCLACDGIGIRKYSQRDEELHLRHTIAILRRAIMEADRFNILDWKELVDLKQAEQLIGDATTILRSSKERRENAYYSQKEAQRTDA